MLNTTYNNNNADINLEFLEDLPVGVVILNKDGLIYYYNAMAKGILGEGYQNCSWLDVIKESIKTISQGGHYISLKNNMEITISTQACSLFKGQILVLTDITNINTEAESHNKIFNLKTLNKLSSTLAHQLKTPLSTAFVYLSTLRDKADSDETLLKPINKSIEQLHTIKYLIENELAIFKSKDIIVEQINIYGLISQVIENYKELYPQMKFHLTNDTMDKQSTFCGHKQAIKSAINNIVDNAVEASNYVGDIDVNIIEIDGKAFISIIDYGEGICQGDFQKIESTFYTTKSQGSGLGIPIAKSIIEAHQGELNFTSNSEYTTFTICLPITKVLHEG